MELKAWNEVEPMIDFLYYENHISFDDYDFYKRNIRKITIEVKINESDSDKQSESS